MQEGFARFNSEIFDHRLPTPCFALTRAKTFRGKLTYRWKRSILGKRTPYEFQIKLSTFFDLPEREWEDVLIHEMIHLHIVSSAIPDSSSHGPAFRSLMLQINSVFGRSISVSSRMTEAQQNLDTRIRSHFILAVRKYDGSLFIAPAMPSAAARLWNMADLFPGVKSWVWFGTIDPWFNRFPRVKSFKMFRADENEIAAHLKGAVRLYLNGKRISTGSPKEGFGLP